MSKNDMVALPERKITDVLNYHAALGAEGWNACLDEIAKLGPLYTHADPAEVERLRAVERQYRRLEAALDACGVSLGVHGANLLTHIQDAFVCDIPELQRKVAERDVLLLEMAKAPVYRVLETNPHEWFRWEGGVRPINKHCACDVVLRDGRVLFNQDPHDFDWSGDQVLAARHGPEPSSSVGSDMPVEIGLHLGSSAPYRGDMTFDYVHPSAEDFQKIAELLEPVQNEALSASAEPTDKQQFREHLDKCAGEVATWPDWKREALGSVDVDEEMKIKAAYKSRPHKPDADWPDNSRGFREFAEGWQARAALERKS